MNRIILVSIFYFLFSAVPASATTLHFTDRPVEFSGPTDFAVTLVVSSDEPLNAFDVTVRYPSEFLRVRSVNTSRSVIDLWQEIPKAKDGVIELRGGSKTPFIGENAEIATINFYAIGPGEGRIETLEARAYIADGRGTPDTVRGESMPVSIALIGVEAPSAEASPAPGFAVTHAPPKDTTPPQITALRIIKNPSGDGSHLLTFEASDAGSGLRSIFARSKRWLAWGPLRETGNPYPLPKGTWKAELMVVDNFGNVAEKNIVLKTALAQKSAGVALGLLVIVGGATALRRYALSRRRARGG